IMDSQARPLWMRDGALESWLPTDSLTWVFSVYGEKGTDGLGIEPSATLSGLPVALWGKWEALGSGSAMTLRFKLLDQTPYELHGDAYRQPDN
ncbi:MAG TPA: hypothetical protein G4N94_08335, partial [Caldilineae bacterium]|nr:hypothetical protein [Caldilineae bacterium]